MLAPGPGCQGLLVARRLHERCCGSRKLLVMESAICNEPSVKAEASRVTGCCKLANILLGRIVA